MTTKKKSKRFKFELSIPGFIFVTGLLICLFLWMFILGFWLGQKIVISKTKKISSPISKEALQVKNKKRLTPPLIPEEVKVSQVVSESKTSLNKPLKEIKPSTKKEKPKTSDLVKFYSIQVASFRSPKEAERYVRMLRDKGYEAFVKKVELPKKGLWYRVYVGRFKTFEKAKNFGLTLQKKEKIKTFYITRLGGNS